MESFKTTSLQSIPHKKEVKDLEKKLKILENKNDDLHRKIVKKTTDLETAYDNQKMEYEETMTSERKEWDTKKTAFKTTAEKLRGDLDSSRSERDDFWEQVRDLQVAKAEVTRLKELSEKLAGTQKKELETQKQHLHEQSHDIKNLTSQSARLQQSLRQGQSYYDGLTAQLDVALGKLNVMTAGSGGHQLQIYLSQIEELKLTKKDVTQERDTIRTNLHSLEEELNNLKTIEKDSKAEIDRIFGLYESTKNNLDEVRDNLSKESLRLLHWQQRSELQSSTIERFQTDYEEIEDSHDWYKETLETNKEYLTEYTERNTMLLDSNSSLTESLRIANEGWDTERRELNDRIENLSLEKSKVISEYEEKIEQWKPLSSELDHLRKLSLGWDNMMMQLQELHGAGTLPTHTPTPRPSRIEASRSSMPLEQSILPPPRSISRSVEQPRRSRSPGPMQRRLSNVSSSSEQSHRLPYQPRASPSGSSISETALRRPSWRDRRPQSVEQLRRSHSPSISNEPSAESVRSRSLARPVPTRSSTYESRPYSFLIDGTPATGTKVIDGIPQELIQKLDAQIERWDDKKEGAWSYARNVNTEQRCVESRLFKINTARNPIADTSFACKACVVICVSLSGSNLGRLWFPFL